MAAYLSLGSVSYQVVAARDSYLISQHWIEPYEAGKAREGHSFLTEARKKKQTFWDRAMKPRRD